MDKRRSRPISYGMKYIFFGTPNFAAIILKKLIDAGLPPAMVVCNPDKPVGRNKIITSPPTKILALENDVEVYQPENLKDSRDQLSTVNYKLAVVAAYAKIIPQEIINIFPKGIIGVHPSLLPKYRGASPIQQAILDGEKETGVTLYLIDKKVDHGPILSHVTCHMSHDYTYITLEEKLARIAGELLVGILPKYAENKISAIDQDHSKATFTNKFVTEDGLVDLEKDDPKMVARKIRALNPEPGLYTIKNGKRLKLLEVKKIDEKWVITKTQLEGKNPKDDKIVLNSSQVD